LPWGWEALLDGAYNTMRFDKEARDFVVLTEVCLCVVQVFLHEHKTDAC